MLDRHARDIEQMRQEIAKLERKIEEAEGMYLTAESSVWGNVFKGFDGFLSSKETRRSRAQKVASKDEYLFSLSSSTSEVWQYVKQEDAQEGEYCQGPTGKRYASKSYAQKTYSKPPAKARRIA